MPPTSVVEGMFTGIVEHLGAVVVADDADRGRHHVVQAPGVRLDTGDAPDAERLHRAGHPVQALEQRMNELGGVILDTDRYSEDDNLRNVTAELLGINLFT